MKASKLSTRKKDLKMILRGVRIAEGPKNNRGSTITEAVEEASVIGGNKMESKGSPFSLEEFAKQIS
jgi:hypothetical protein